MQNKSLSTHDWIDGNCKKLPQLLREDLPMSLNTTKRAGLPLHLTPYLIASLILVFLLETMFVIYLPLKRCAQGIALPGDITWVIPSTPETMIATGFSLVPYAIGVVALGCYFKNRTKGSFLFISCGLILLACNELIIKRLPGISQSRPQASCLLTNGNPSSHSLLCTGYWLLGILECIFGRNIVGSLREKSYFLIGWSFLLVPVPYCRVILQDHSPSQAGLGSLLGVVLALFIYFLFNRHDQKMRGRD